MNALQQLVSEKVFLWPDGIDMICVSKRSQWMLRHAKDEQLVDGETTALFKKLGPCSSLYKHQSFSRSDFEKLQAKRNGSHDQ